jgi:septal ring factor EnvC (AmiA/AmiB activator)
MKRWRLDALTFRIPKNQIKVLSGLKRRTTPLIYIQCCAQYIMENNKKTTKIEAAIKDTKLRLEHVKQEIMLMIRERDTLQKQLDSLETIQESKHFE